ncbi:MAG: prolipoprotein diacylglyceryl transferase [Clostridiales bacterium]|nr:prolipoprotein diacylglyceryl transferase [Candidatus Crickella merdequi]
MQSPGPVAFSIFGIDIMWYGILIASAMLLAVFICYRRAGSFGIDPENVLDLCLFIIPIGVVGARIYYIIFNYNLYSGDIGAMLNFRNGGLAIHGGLIAGLITAFIICRKKNIIMLDMCDLVLPAVALAQSIGRWGNFFNSEAHGGPTDLPWAIVVNGQHVHPTFLYESIWCLLLFLFLSYMCRKRLFPGQIACLYGILYSVERFFVEALRTDSLMIGPFRQAQVLSLSIIVICAVLYRYLKKQHFSDER